MTAPRRPASSTALARRLRNHATPDEVRLWQHLRCRRLGGHRFRRQHPIGPFVVDFVCLERRLVVELDGGQHCDAAGADARRTIALEREGFTVLRFWNSDVRALLSSVLDTILAALERRAAG